MKSVKVEDAVGMVLAHDLTKIVPGTFKGAAFKKGHIVRQEDIEALKDAGKYNVFVVSLEDGRVHEDEAAGRVAAAAAGNGLVLSGPAEGKVTIRSAVHGLLKVNTQAMDELNMIGNIALVSLHNYSMVEADQVVAASKIIPLAMEREGVEKAEEICRRNAPVVDVKPLRPLKAGIVVTGNEVYEGRIKDRFGAILAEKVAGYGGETLEIRLAPDDTDFIGRQIMEMMQKGAGILLVSGGMAVDADDVTPKAIESVASEVITYGMPLLPGAMCMIAYCGQIPVVGVPACGMFHKTTVLDVLLPRFFAGERINRRDIVSMGHGGLCLHCETCRYPVCPFGK